MSIMKPKRFWKEAKVAEVDGGFRVELDGRPVRTPAKTLVILPTRALAEAIAQEWEAQEGEVDPANMPFTRTANSALDKVATQHDEVAAMLAEYGGTDLLCYRATSPAELIDRQAALWDPMLDWADQTFGARLATSGGIMHVAQDAVSLAKLAKNVHKMDNFQLAAFHDLVGISGSLVLAFAAALNQQEIAAIWDLSRVDETWQEEQWGVDDEATEQAAKKRAEFLHAKAFFDLCQPFDVGID
jgi:chaperone required for assembly of F1-ATPase